MSSFDLGRFVASQKALGPHPAFMDRSTTVSNYQVGGRAPRGASLISQRNASLHADAYGGTQAIDHVYDAINLYSDALSSAEYKLSKTDGTPLVRSETPGTPPDYEVGPADLYKLLDQPNDFTSYSEMISLMVIDLLLVGNAYWYKHQTDGRGRPLNIFRLAPSMVKIKPGPHGPLEYEYKPNINGDAITFQPDEVIHFKRPNPHDPWYGLGVIQGAGRAMDLELAVTDTTAHYYENRADPSLIIQSERRVPQDIFRKVASQLRAKVAGPRNAGEMLLLESGLTASTLDRSASEAMFDRLALMSRDRIYAKFRAAPILFGILDASSGQNKVTDLRRDFDNSTLRPFADKVSKQVTMALTEAWGVTYVIDHRSNLPADEQIKVIETVGAIPGIKVREVRRLLAPFGIEESTGDPELDEMVLNKPTPESDKNGQQVDPVTGEVVSSAGLGADKPLGSEAGRPPKGENTRAFGVAGAKSLDDSIESILADLEGKAMNAAGENVSIGRLDSEVAPMDPFSRARDTDITSISRSIEADLQAAATDLERDLLGAVEGKALKTSDIVSRVRNHEAWKKFRLAVSDALKAGIASSSRSGAMYSGLTPDEDIDYDSIADEIVNRPGGLNSIVKTLKDQVVARVKAARADDAERQDYTDEIKNVIKDWNASKAQTVAETEAVHGYNEATLVASELSGVTHVWVTDGDDHDQPCRDADGSIWPIEEAREKRLEHPRCRRAFLPITAVG